MARRSSGKSKKQQASQPDESLQTKKLDLVTVVSRFLTDVEVRGRTKTTLITYRYRLQMLVELLKDVCNVTELEVVTVDHLRQCVQYLMTTSIDKRGRKKQAGEKLDIETIRAFVRVCKVFFSWCCQEDLLENNPTARLIPPKPVKRVISTFTPDQIDKMLSVCDPGTETGFRDYVILLLLLDTGMRISEIVGLCVQDIHEDYVKVFGKGRKEREIGIHPEVSKLLWKYVNKYRFPSDPNETRLFIGRGKPLNQSGLKKVIARIKHDSGLDDIKLSAHVFRHTFAKMYLEQGGEVFKLSREMGHSDVHITKIYLEPTFRSLGREKIDLAISRAK